MGRLSEFKIISKLDMMCHRATRRISLDMDSPTERLSKTDPKTLNEVMPTFIRNLTFVAETSTDSNERTQAYRVLRFLEELLTDCYMANIREFKITNEEEAKIYEEVKSELDEEEIRNIQINMDL